MKLEPVVKLCLSEAFAAWPDRVPELSEGMRELARWARRRRLYQPSSIWKDVAGLDLTAAAAELQGWIHEGLAKLTQKKAVEVVLVDLGESPEIFNMRGCKASGEGSMSLAAGAEMDFEAIAWGDEVDLTYHRTDSLPGDVWKLFPWCDAKPRLDVHSGYLLWLGFACLVLARELLSEEIDFARVLGRRRVIPVFIGFGGWPCVALGALTPRGWRVRGFPLRR